MLRKSPLLTNILWTIVLVVTAVATVLSVSYSISKAERVSNSPVLEIKGKLDEQSNTLTTSSEKASETNLPLANAQLPLSQVVNGIEIKLIDFQITEEQFQAELCYQLPNDEDWLLGDRAEDITLSDNNISVPMSGYNMIDLLASSDGLSTYRCDIVNFPIPKAQLLGQITITINRLVTSTPEVPDCALAQEKLDSAGITIKCSDAEGFFGYEIIQKPDSLTEGQTSDIVHESFMDIVSGPWVFIVNLEK